MAKPPNTPDIPPAGPTAADHFAGIQALNRTYAAALLRKLARDHLGDEVNHAELPHPGGDLLIVSLDEVRDWMHGVAIRLESGADF